MNNLQSFSNINYSFSELVDDEVLFFIRIKGKSQYFNLFYPDSFMNEFKNLKSFRTISEYKKNADVVIDLTKYKVTDLAFEDYEFIDNNFNCDEIIKRCRGLRAIPNFEAKNLIYVCCKFFLEFYKSNPQLKLIVSGTVDNYVMDIMVKLADYFNIKCIGIANFFLVPKYKLITKYGEANNFREPSKSEVSEVLEGLLKSKSSPLAISKTRAFFNAFRHFISFYYRFVIRYCYYYKIKRNLGYEYRFAPYLKAFNSLSQLVYSNSFYNKLDISFLKNNRDNLVYVPLHCFPEATMDYWTDHPDKANYYDYMIRVITFFNERNIIVVLKEHPAFYLSREIEFYRSVKKFPNVIILNPFVKTKSVFDQIKNVIVWNGSTGVEAIISDKNVYCVTESYYSSFKIPHYTSFGEIKHFTTVEKQQLVEAILKSTLKVQ